MDAPPKPQRNVFVVSDFHLGEGSPLPDGRANRLEDFPERNERLFIGMVEARLAMLPPDAEFTLVCNGDMFDYHAVRFRGRFGVVPTEEAALAKTEAILRGHPTFCGGLRRLLAERPRMGIVFTDGNHDPELNWPSVQEKIRAALSPPAAEASASAKATADEPGGKPEGQGHRIEFRAELVIGDALISHSDEIDPLSANPPAEELFKQDVVVGRTVMLAIAVLSFLLMGTVASLVFSWVPYSFGGIAVGTLFSFAGVFLVLRWIAGNLPFRWSRETTALNVPFASYMNAGLGMFIKRRFLPDVGRREDHGDEWILALARKPYVLPILLPSLVIWAIGHRFFLSFRRPREKFSLRLYLQLIASTTRPDQIAQALRRYLESRPQIRYYVTGHTHQPMVATYEVSGRTVVYLNTGTGIMQIRMLKPPVTATTGWPRVEIFFRRIAFLWQRTPLRAILSTLAYAALPAAVFAVSVWRGWPIGLSHWALALLALVLLLWWQFAAEYKGTTFIEFTPGEIIESPDGASLVRLLRYDPDRRFRDFLTGEEIVS